MDGRTKVYTIVWIFEKLQTRAIETKLLKSLKNLRSDAVKVMHLLSSFLATK